MDEPREALASIILPEALGLRRDRVVPERFRTEAFDPGYDFTTLVYDAACIEGRGVWLFCPKLCNLERPLRRAVIEIDGAPARIRRIRRFERHDIVEIPCPTPARRMRLVLEGWESETEISPDESARFAGRNCLLTLSRNNELRWIRDWVVHHVRGHGADALLFYDNGSEAYGAAEIRAALAGIDGLAEIRILRVPFLYGPQASRRMKFTANFLQAALLNLARWRFLDRASAVLSCDVDEMVFGTGGRTIFEATRAARSGFVRFRGRWRYPDSAPGETPLHRDHYLRGPAESLCPPKYCIVPGGPMRGRAWATHSLRGTPFGRRFVTREFFFLHCFGISDFWKGRPLQRAREASDIDEEARRLLAGPG